MAAFDARRMLMGHRNREPIVVNALNCASFRYRAEHEPERQHQLWACGDCNRPERLWLVIMGAAGALPMMTDVLVAEITNPQTGLLAPPERVVVYDDAGAPYVLLRQQ